MLLKLFVDTLSYCQSHGHSSVCVWVIQSFICTPTISWPPRIVPSSTRCEWSSMLDQIVFISSILTTKPSASFLIRFVSLYICACMHTCVCVSTSVSLCVLVSVHLWYINDDLSKGLKGLFIGKGEGHVQVTCDVNYIWWDCNDASCLHCKGGKGDTSSSVFCSLLPFSYVLNHCFVWVYGSSGSYLLCVYVCIVWMHACICVFIYVCIYVCT